MVINRLSVVLPFFLANMNFQAIRKFVLPNIAPWLSCFCQEESFLLPKQKQSIQLITTTKKTAK